MCQFDEAQELELFWRELSLARQLSKTSFHLVSSATCCDCEDEIPKARRDIGGIGRCVECQTRFERFGK